MPAPIKVIADFGINDSFVGNVLAQGASSVAGLTQGGFVVSYGNYALLSGFVPDQNTAITARYGASGNLLNLFNTDFPVGGNLPSTDVVNLPDGRLARVVEDVNSLGNVDLLVFDIAGLTGLSSVTVAGASAFRPQVTGTLDGAVAVTWFDGANGFIRLYNAASNALTTAIPVTTTSVQNAGYRPDVTTLFNGNLVVSWTDAGGASFRILNPNGTWATPITAVSSASVSHASVSATADGGFVAVTLDATAGLTNSPNVVFYDSGGSFRFKLNIPAQVGADLPLTRVAGLPDGRVMVVWSALNTSGSEVWGQMITATGQLDGAAFRVNSNTTGDAYDPSIAILADGRVVVSWTSTASGSPRVLATVYDPREAGLYLTGASLADDWVGSFFADAMFGGLGNDTIQGGDGGDTLAGESGNDTLNGGNGADFLYGGTGADTLDGGFDNDFLLGELGDDTLTGGLGADNLLGGDGADFLSGGDGNDGLFGENGNDFILGFFGDDTAFGGAGGDFINGEAGADTLRGESGADTIFGGSENDTILGGDDSDSLSGDSGADQLFGEGGNDQMSGGSENDILLGGDGVDVLNGDGGNDQLFGEAGNDTLFGGDNNDLLQGGAGNDDLRGGSGNDTLHGGFGNDQYRGEAGQDIFAFVRSEMNASDVDEIFDWSQSDDGIQIFGATAANISTAVVGPDVLIVVSLAGGGTSSIFVRGTTNNVAVFNDIQFL